MLDAFIQSLARGGVTSARQRDSLRVLRAFDRSLGDRSLVGVQGPDLARFLALRREVGCAPNTLRKERQIVVTFFAWACNAGHVTRHTMLALREVKSPSPTSSLLRPNPYSRSELRTLRETLETRWPKLETGEAQKRLVRWRERESPYPRIRKHAIRLQVEAVVALCLHGGLRRAEVFGLCVDDVHPDNAYVVVWKGERFGSEAHEVPFTEACRARVAEWIDFRAGIDPSHKRPWLNLWASETAREPMARATFDKLLANYLGREWSFRRLRHTAGVNWLHAGMSVWELQRLLGHKALRDTLPYAEALDVPLGRRVERLEESLTRRLPLAA